MQETNAVLATKQAQLAKVEADLDALRKHYQKTVDELAEIQRAMQITATRLVNAGRLTAALGDEQERWELAVKVIILSIY